MYELMSYLGVCGQYVGKVLAYHSLIEFRAILSREIRNKCPQKRKKNDALVVGDSEYSHREVARGGDGLIGSRISVYAAARPRLLLKDLRAKETGAESKVPKLS